MDKKEELERRKDEWMERKGEGEYVEQRARPQRLQKWKDQMCFFLQPTEEASGRGGRPGSQTGFKSRIVFMVICNVFWELELVKTAQKMKFVELL